MDINLIESLFDPLVTPTTGLNHFALAGEKLAPGKGYLCPRGHHGFGYLQVARFHCSQKPLDQVNCFLAFQLITFSFTLSAITQIFMECDAIARALLPRSKPPLTKFIPEEFLAVYLQPQVSDTYLLIF
jgi:hypothetical protein